METLVEEHVLERDEIAPFLIHIRPSVIPQAWPVIEPILQKACDESRGEFTLQRIVANLENWPILAIVRNEKVQAVMVTCISETEAGRKLHCLLASGDHAREWPQVDDQLDEFARAHGCTRLRIDHARKGWAKTLPHWKIVAYVMEREI